MRALITLTVIFLAATPVWAAGTDLKPSQIFATDSPSIVVVVAYGQDGKAIAQGSGVVIARDVDAVDNTDCFVDKTLGTYCAVVAQDTVVSNCHVIEKANTAGVLYQNKRFAATLRYEDVERDLCSFTVKGLSAPAVQMGYTAQVQVGDAAYAIGAPEGLELTLSGGLISSLRKIPGGVVLQMTTPISPGSSGGGLFDAQGRLIGITSYYMKGGEQLNFALPVEWVRELPQHGKLTSVTRTRIASTAGVTQGSELQNGIRALQAGDYAAAFKTLTRLAKEGNAMAQFYLGVMYDDGDGITKDETRASAWYRKAAAQGLAHAQFNLGLDYDTGEGVPQDYAQAAAWFRKAAVQGVAEAQTNLGVMYAKGQGMPQDYAQAAAWNRKAAEQGYGVAESNLGGMYANGQGVPQDYTKAVYWFRKAAIQGEVEGLLKLGVMYFLGHGVAQDYVAAYALFNIAAVHDSSGNNQGEAMRSIVDKHMTPEQVEAGQALTREMQRIGTIKAVDEYLNGGAQ